MFPPAQTYAYHSLPFCQPAGKTLRHKSDSLVRYPLEQALELNRLCAQGVLLEGSDLTDSGLIMHFRGTSMRVGLSAALTALVLRLRLQSRKR